MNFSVCMSVYRNDNPDHFRTAVYSVYRQTVQPTEIILIVDGYVGTPLQNEIKLVESEIPIMRVVWLAKNVGLGNALRIAITEASYDIIARMDSDDIAVETRFEKQLKFFENNNDYVSIVGGAIAEFIDIPDNIVGYRICPQTDAEIKQYMKSRCGFNHMTVMFRKTDVLKAGNYQDWHYNEDYYLWIRMLLAGAVFYNIQEVIVNVRVGLNMYARRGGWKYFKSEYLLQKYMLNNGIVSGIKFMINVFIRFIVQVAMPNKVRAFVFQKILRK